MVVRPARDEHGAVGLAAEHVVVAGHLERDLDGLRPARREDHVVEVAGRQTRDPLGQGDGRLGREDVADGVRQARRLVGDRVDHLLAAVADVGHRDPGDRIEILASVLVPDADAVGTLEDRVGPRRVEREQGAGIGAGVGRHHIPPRQSNRAMMTARERWFCAADPPTLALRHQCMETRVETPSHVRGDHEPEHSSRPAGAPRQADRGVHRPRQLHGELSAPAAARSSRGASSPARSPRPRWPSSAGSPSASSSSRRCPASREPSGSPRSRRPTCCS